MEKILYAQLMVMNILVLAVVWQNDVYRSRGPLLLNQKLFRIIIGINIGAMVCDVLQVLFNGTTYPFSNLIENVTIFLYYALHSLVGFVFVMYVDYELFPDNKRFKRRVPYYALLAVVAEVMAVLSFWTEWFFVIDESNNYIRGSLFYIPIVFAFIYMAYILHMLIRYKRENMADNSMQKELYKRLFVFPILPCLGALLQIVLPGTSWTFPATTLAVLINYTTIQNGYMARDHLTGLFNRGQLENFMNYQLKNIKKGNYFFLILIDMDKFKEINDTYGHVVGDDALINAAKLLRGSCKRKSDYVARLGGDEFVIIGQCEDVAAVDMIIKRMHGVVERFNIISGKPYKIQFSAGYTIYDGNGQATLDKLISEADDKMYEIKKAKKNKEKIQNNS